MGYKAYGTDLDKRMVSYCLENIEWLAKAFKFEAEFKAEPGDATNYQWDQTTDFVASETYLGRPFTSPPAAEILAQTVSDCNLIIKKFLQNIHRQLKPGTRLCLAVPAWQTKPGQFRRLSLVDQISDLGYNSISFEHSGEQDLIYYRKDQIVARQLIVITRI